MFDIIPYEDTCRQDVVRLLGTFWRLGEAQADAFFQWKYIDCPYSDSVNIILLKANGVVVGMRGAGIRMLALRSGEAAIRVGCLGDTLIEKPYRGQGQFTPMTDALLEMLVRNDISIALNMSASQPVRDSSVKHGWQSTDYFSSWRWVSEDKKNHPGGFTVSDQALGYIQPTDHGNLIYSDEIFSVPMANLCESRPGHGKLEFSRDITWNNWRYHNPLNRYRFLYLFESDNTALNSGQQESIDTTRLKGYLVLASRAGANQAYIADWGYANTEVLEQLAEVLLQINPFYQLLCINSPDCELAKLLNRLASPDIRQPELQPSKKARQRTRIRILVRPLTNAGQEFFDRARLVSGLNTDNPCAWHHAPIHLDDG